MAQVCQAVDHGDCRMMRPLFDTRVVERADYEAVNVAREHGGGIRDRLAAR